MMHTILTLLEDATDEMTGADHYANMAMQFSAEYPQVASFYKEKAKIEMEHAQDFMQRAESVRQKFENEHPEKAETANAILSMEKKRAATWMAKIKMKLDGNI